MEEWKRLNDLIQVCYSMPQKTSIVYMQYQHPYHLTLSILIDTQLYQLVYSDSSVLSLYSHLSWITNTKSFIDWFYDHFIHGDICTTLVEENKCRFSIGEPPSLLTLVCPLVQSQLQTNQFIQSLIIKLAHHVQIQHECQLFNAQPMHHQQPQQKIHAEQHHALSPATMATATPSMLGEQWHDKPSSSLSPPQPSYPSTHVKHKATSLLNPSVKRQR
ncbi:uncharacterized protein BX664DRAFT_346260 [Halteromyces radiatus]|uniref:uncharacterized protein n=1 Tax=Halteromyces radiatus TaxID=101107 RepID=UPI0022204312|nr:uncharacterized protein BX664DRAFT_346260 [Halteromyces radiatus]KAI8096177.1 hypothetical protein BX664DRAFT_346260 [Halteromyces radiatus]